MAKKIKMVLYGEPGVGKSVFAIKSPKPFFATTDGNYEWLEEFGADPKAHKRLAGFEEFQSLVQEITSTNKYDKYETIVVDLLEDLFKWAEQEYCIRNKFEHVSEIGYGKGYDITRNNFFLEVSKLLNLDKHIILIMHGQSSTKKDRRGVEFTIHGPTNRLPDKLVSMLEGRVRYFLRAYLGAEEVDGKIHKKRYLSLVPKENEFGIIRGVNENSIPHDIPLNWDTFYNIVTTTSPNVETIIEDKPKDKVENKISSLRKKKEEKSKVNENENYIEVNENENYIEKEDVSPEHSAEEEPKLTLKEKMALLKAKKEAQENPKVEENLEKEEPKLTSNEEKESSNKVNLKDKLAAIKAKMGSKKEEPEEESEEESEEEVKKEVSNKSRLDALKAKMAKLNK